MPSAVDAILQHFEGPKCTNSAVCVSIWSAAVTVNGTGPQQAFVCRYIIPGRVGLRDRQPERGPRFYDPLSPSYSPDT